MRADIWQYYEHVHHYYGCPHDKPCDHYDLPEPLEWEQALLTTCDDVECCDSKFAEQNLKDWSELASIAHQFEALIRERWLRMTITQRKTLLLEVWPKLPLHHRPDVDDMVIDACAHQRNTSRLVRYALPYLNLEDLTLPNPMLLLINARSRYPPSTFALSDYEMARMIHLRPTLLEPTKSSMVMAGSYGEILQLDTEADAMASINRGEAVHPRVGHQILLMQHLLLDFLLNFAFKMLPDKIDTIMPELLEADLGLEELPPLLDNGDQYTTLATIIREAPYGIPAVLNIGRLRALVSARANEAEDHIWLLREDPSYFAEVVFELREHRPELLPGLVCGRTHANSRDDVLWARVLRNVAVDGYIELSTWTQVLQHITKLESLSQECAKDFGVDQDLPKEYFDVLVETWFFLEATQLDLIQQLKLGFPASPGVRAHWSQMCEPATEDDIMGSLFTPKFKKKPDPDVKRALTLFTYLWEPQKRETLGIHTIVEVLENMLQNNSRAKVMTSAWVASCLSQLSIITECLRQLNCFQPWAKRVKCALKDRKTKLLIAYISDLSKWHPILNTSFKNTNLVTLGKPGIKFRYPINKRRTRANVETLRSAEAALDKFWEAADDHFRVHVGKMPCELVQDITGERDLQRTPPWVDPEKKSLHPQVNQYIHVPISNTKHDPSKQITGNFDKLAIVTNDKTKTHGTACPSFKPPSCVAKGDGEHQRTYHVDARSHKVFRMLFHAPFSTSPPREVPWTDFLHAMVAAGFSAQKLQGSAWQFTPKGLDVERPIQFHEPHPQHKLPFTWARRFGRRLHSAYGWTGATFGLE
ncbi:hypothetical protein BDU57DRAFT_491555 [Ampelomyces quisqualis]|uniref:Uncharacterized protein n=1 Tax=Ampelomyces quisqualis TaxID=50730 RepID=A0A6A5QU57_AMPQU|nr:hypothetical protein BDU57DRAFT_491555 [Ampelomyces quisqualis]